MASNGKQYQNNQKAVKESKDNKEKGEVNMAKGGRGGKRTASQPSGVSSKSIPKKAVQQNPAQQSNQPTQTVNISASGGASSFATLTDQQQAQMVDASLKQGVPNFLSDTAFQKLMYNNELDGKPQLVDDATLDSMAGADLFRNVNATYDRATDVGYSATEIAQQIQMGDFTRYSDSGGSAHGRGLYFSNDYSGSALYGRTSNNIKKTAVVRCKIDQTKAKIITTSDCSNGVQKEINSGSALGKSLKGLSRADSLSIYALSKGYNVICSSRNPKAGRDDYFSVLDRSVLVMSTTIKPKSGSW